MQLNLDIWRDIIDYFECSEDEKTLRSLALTSRTLLNPALDALWRNGEEIENIVSIINSFARSPSEPILEYIQEIWKKADYDDGEDLVAIPPSRKVRVASGWVLNKPLPHTARTRALEYLARIKELSLYEDGPPPTTEKPVWPILSTILNPREPLLPNLRCLKILYYSYDRIDYLIPFLSPSIKILVLANDIPPKLRATPNLLNLAKASGCDLEAFTYAGPLIRDLPKVITPFETLQSVEFPLDHDPLQVASITIIELLASLPSLRSLACHLDVFPPLEGAKRFYHACLQVIITRSTPGALRTLFRRCVFPSATEVTIWTDGQIPSLEGLELRCPNTRKLDLYFLPSLREDTDHALEFGHIASLLPLSPEVFNIVTSYHNLTQSHFYTFARSWPSLRSLQMSQFVVSDPLMFLTTFSNHCPSLETIGVQLLLCDLFGDIPKIPELMEKHVTIQASRPCLRMLEFSCHCSPPSWDSMVTTAEERGLLGEYLYLLFPSLEELVSSTHITEVEDIQEILLELREARKESRHLA